MLQSFNSKQAAQSKLVRDREVIAD